ncbi:hypothetical protein [Helicobacter turcicus]|uniref:Uncharacterized protein n=1 Tax=Helicobacter turcicus TaxID=2867412 RepID=A0ABS7JLT0_9HELI|nr:hypothetical protein [Helicobacter turcicus]MBX7490354.1 hypothetical protein [Helicobacter turcicus]MBX7545067.1 hypothetical protein [Helicobacter turcicus]
MSVIFGKKTELESFSILQFLYGDFSVFGVKEHCKEAVEFTLKTLRENKRVEALVLVHLDLNRGSKIARLEPQEISTKLLKNLKIIQSFGTKIYFFFKRQKRIPISSLEAYKDLAETGIVFLYKA